MSAPVSKERRPDGAALVIAALLAGLAAVIFWQTQAMPVTAQYARVGPTTLPYVDRRASSPCSRSGTC